MLSRGKKKVASLALHNFLFPVKQALGALGGIVPEISRFLGIVIAMYYNDHAPSHFHARYGEYEIRVNIETGEIMSGSFPQRARKHVFEWLDLHRPELVEDWILAEERKPLRKIEPLE